MPLPSSIKALGHRKSPEMDPFKPPEEQTETTRRTTDIHQTHMPLSWPTSRELLYITITSDSLDNPELLAAASSYIRFHVQLGSTSGEHFSLGTWRMHWSPETSRGPLFPLLSSSLEEEEEKPTDLRQEKIRGKNKIYLSTGK